MQASPAVADVRYHCQRDGVFVSKHASDAGIHEFLNVINVDDDAFKKATP
jgi:hypothetical protein